MKLIKKAFKFTGLALVITATLTGCDNTFPPPSLPEKTSVVNTQQTLTTADAQQFLDEVAKEMVTLNLEGSRAAWIYANFITEDTAALAAQADQKSNYVYPKKQAKSLM